MTVTEGDAGLVAHGVDGAHAHVVLGPGLVVAHREGRRAVGPVLHAPPLSEYWYDVIGLPPLAPGVTVTVSLPLACEGPCAVGAAGAVAGGVTRR